jgi:hypothetical protein
VAYASAPLTSASLGQAFLMRRAQAAMPPVIGSLVTFDRQMTLTTLCPVE